MMDVSDGLASEVHHLARESGVGFRLWADQVPIAPEAQVVARLLDQDPGPGPWAAGRITSSSSPTIRRWKTGCSRPWPKRGWPSTPWGR